MAIALLLRGALEQPDRRAALVTPDRDLAGRVAAELGRFGVVADDSAGETLAETPPAVFLRLLAAGGGGGAAPGAAAGAAEAPAGRRRPAAAACRAAARALERERCAARRRPPGWPGCARVPRAERAAASLDRVEACLARCWRWPPRRPPRRPTRWRALIAGRRGAGHDAGAGRRRRLWSGEDGQALAALLGELLPALAVLPPQPAATLPGLLEAALAGAVVRSRRALRGRGGAEHPRVFIWGLLEARLQRADLIVLGGLAEGVWPAAADPGPWMSRPMRAAAGCPRRRRRSARRRMTS